VPGMPCLAEGGSRSLTIVLLVFRPCVAVPTSVVDVSRPLKFGLKVFRVRIPTAAFTPLPTAGSSSTECSSNNPLESPSPLTLRGELPALSAFCRISRSFSDGDRGWSFFRKVFLGVNDSALTPGLEGFVELEDIVIRKRRRNEVHLGIQDNIPRSYIVGERDDLRYANVVHIIIPFSHLS